MANSQAPFGLRPVRSESGETRVNYYPLSSASARVYEGDLVMLSSGKVIKATVAAQTSVLGVAARESGALAAGGISSFPVYDDPGTEFHIQATTAATATSIGLMLPITLGTLTNNAGISVVSADVASAQALTYSVTQPLIMLGLANTVGNESGNYATIRVKIQSHVFNS